MEDTKTAPPDALELPARGKHSRKKERTRYEIPDRRRSLIFELESTECELTLANTVKQFDSGKGDGGGVEVLLKPSMRRALDLMSRWSCSTRLFRYFEDRSFVLGNMSAFCISRTARWEAA
jgi:hypothetical protein